MYVPECMHAHTFTCTCTHVYTHSLSATTTTPYPQFASTPATAAAAAMGTNHHHPLLHRRGKPLPAWSEIKSESSLQEGVVSKTRRAATGGSSSKTEKSAEQDGKNLGVISFDV